MMLLEWHIVWKWLKMSHFNFSILAFSTNFWCPIKADLSGNTVWPQASGFQKIAKLTIFGIFWLTFVHSKCWMRFFSVIFKHREWVEEQPFLFTEGCAAWPPFPRGSSLLFMELCGFFHQLCRWHIQEVSFYSDFYYYGEYYVYLGRIGYSSTGP